MHPPTQPPTDYKNAGTMMLVSGAFNVMTSAGILIGLALSLIGLCVAPIWMLTLAGGVMEIVIGITIMQGKPTRMGLSTSVVGLCCAVGCGNVLGMILEILAMVNLGKPEVGMWLADPSRPALPPNHGGYGGGRPPGIEGRGAPPPAGPRPPADFPSGSPRPAEPAVSWTWDMPLAPKGKMHGSR